ncbi:MAG: cytochrome c-type biogenesis protein CcsB [Patiriisocius sp.]
MHYNFQEFLMLQLLKKTLFSNKLMVILLLVFTFAIGIATFIENDYGTEASKKVIFNAHWFELVIFLLGLNLIGNIFKYKLYRKEKWTVFMFHTSWILIVIGAGVTRYYGYEGSMHIREGEASHRMVSQRTFVQFQIDDKVKQLVIDKPILTNKLYNSKFDYNLDFEGKEVSIKYLDFITNAVDSVVETTDGKEIIELVTVGKDGRQSVFLESGMAEMFGPFPVSFNGKDDSNMAIKINSTDLGLTILSPYEIQYMTMADQSVGTILPDSVQPFEQRRLYTLGQTQIVYKTIVPSGELRKVSVDEDKKLGHDILKIAVSSGGEEHVLNLPGGAGYISPKTRVKINGLNFSGSYGSKFYELPFEIKLRDFQLETYPGSESPSSYASEVTLIDNEKALVEDHRIYMNHVLDHRGYRFFQSSYDEDQLGTVLSVNSDFWGTIITYIGYLLLTLGMILTYLAPKTRFNQLRKKLRKVRAKRLKGYLSTAMVLLSLGVNAQEESFSIAEEHAEKFEQLIVQGGDGRFMPLQTYTSQLARKITVAKKYKGMTPSQFVLSMIYDRGYWQEQNIIKLDNVSLAEELDAEKLKVGMSNMYFVSFRKLFTETGYVLEDKVAQANRKPEKERNKYDKELIKLDERVNICYLIYHDAQILSLFPNPLEPDGSWYNNGQLDNFQDTSQLFVKHIIPLYMSSIEEAKLKNDWSIADKSIEYISDFQRKFGHHVMPDQEIIDLELTYNKYKFFDRSMLAYLLVGFLLLIFGFIEIFRTNKFIQIMQWILIGILGLTFVYHAFGLGYRWWIADHAPWSNAYEALTYIAWGTMFAGFLFIKSSRISMASTAILAGMTLFVAWLNWLNPEITNLQPVLKSYWLTIHVAIITSSYAFLGLGAILGLVNMTLMIARNNRNKEKINDSINELTYISEMTITIGTFAAAIGTFLGGVWANESWGRYWGWDPKETWALVIVLTYTIVLHLRLIPGWTGKYIFNLASLFAYGTVLMTFFGVNYYLSGLHSYAGGSPPPLPAFVIPTLVLFVVISIVAYFRQNRMKRLG